MSAARGWNLRPACPDDVDAVSALLDRSYIGLWAGHYPADLLERVRPYVTRANPRLLASGLFYVALSDAGLAVGCGGWNPEAPGSNEITPGVTHIRHFATDPAWLRLGIGATILRRCIAEARASGAAMLLADAALGAEPFYAALGFVVDAPTAPLIAGIPLPGVMMKRALS